MILFSFVTIILRIEPFQVEMCTSDDIQKLHNILKPKQILYPVSFAMRKGEHDLRRYMNLKLLELDRDPKNGILDLIKKELFDNFEPNDPII